MDVYLRNVINFDVHVYVLDRNNEWIIKAAILFAEDNVPDFISCGAMEELVRISQESSREDIRNLAKRTLNMNPTFVAGIQRAWENICVHMPLHLFPINWYIF